MAFQITIYLDLILSSQKVLASLTFLFSLVLKRSHSPQGIDWTIDFHRVFLSICLFWWLSFSKFDENLDENFVSAIV